MKPVLALISSAMLLAQQTPQQPPVFRGGITIVPLTVTVLDKNGKPVTDLKQSDFTILEDGKPQQIKTFFADERKPQEPKPDGDPALTKPVQFSEATPATRRAFLLVLGYGRIEAPAKSSEGALEFIRTRLMPQDAVAIIAFNRATNFTTNHELAAETVERFRAWHEKIVNGINEFYYQCYNRGQAFPDFIQSEIDGIFQPAGLRNAGMKSLSSLLAGSPTFEQDRATSISSAGAAHPDEKPFESRIVTQDILKVYAGIEYLRYVEGDRHLVWFSEFGLEQKALPGNCPKPGFGGKPMFVLVEAGPTGLAARHWTKQDDELLARRASDAGVVTDIIHTFGVIGNRGGSLEFMPPLATMDFIQSSEYIAELTGGQFTGVTYAGEMLKRIDDATRFTYLLGYTPANNKLDDGYRQVQVKVKRPGLTVLYRHGYTATEDTRPVDVRQLLTMSRLNTAASTEEESRDIELQAKASIVSGLGVSRRVVVDLTIDPKRLTFGREDDRNVATLDVKAFCGDNKIVGELDDTLDLRFTDADFQRVLKSGIRTTIRVPINGDPKYVKVLVYDFRADLLGTTTVKLK